MIVFVSYCALMWRSEKEPGPNIFFITECFLVSQRFVRAELLLAYASLIFAQMLSRYYHWHLRVSDRGIRDAISLLQP